MTHARSEVKAYSIIFVALLLLLALTVEAARHDLGRWNFIVAVAIATLKMLLIVLFFMHVRHSPPLTRLVVAAGVVWLAIMFALAFADYATRGWV
jgi:cytochrome c oxidase subunit 4